MEGYNKIDYNEIFKLRPRKNASNKHEVIKLEIVLKLIDKYKKNLFWTRVYTEYPIRNTKGETKIVDVYFQNLKSKEIICYEVQNKVNDKYVKETNEFYINCEDLFFKTDWVLVKENELSDDLNLLEEEVKELII